ncbi:maturase K [Dissostichus eleginoides]|uniref:Maturase K n=1 Tax=Dissostichus eleginoides TaxID=100907 RepID=A0AAD9CMP7_DISEL|nr:maturase K [Dissostichus eleginoides]
MFPDSEIAKKFACGKDKTGYIVRFGLARYFKEQLVNSINKAGPFVLMFDESLNQATKKKQMDVHFRYWDDGCVRARYLGSQFLGHGRAEELLHHIKECGAQLKMRQLMSVSMDGPNVNFKLVNLLQKEQAELYGGAQLVLVGSCGLHTLHNAVKAGFTMWQLERLLRAMQYLFHNVPARREDFTSLTGSSCFPLPFCGHRWVENVRVAERAVEIWPILQKYVVGVKNKKIPNPATASYDTIAAAQGDPLIIAKPQFFFAISRTFSPFLLKFQTDEPVMPFLTKYLAELLKIQIPIAS